MIRRHPFISTLFGLVMIATLAPVFLVVLSSFNDSNFLIFPPEGWSMRWYREFFGKPAILGSLRFSGFMALATALGALLIGASAALGLSLFGKGSRLISFARAAVFSPLFVPTIVLATALKLLLSILQVSNSWTNIWFGQLTIAVPLTIAILGAGLARLDGSIIEAARGLGAGWPTVILRIVIPNIAGSVGAAFAFAAIYSFNDAQFAVLLAGPDTNTLTAQLFADLRFRITPILAVSSTVFIVLTTLILIAGGWAFSRGRVRR